MLNRSAGSSFDVLTFDCYGTLIDWEAGILSAMRPLLSRHGARLGDEEILALHATLESEAETGPFRSYRSVLARVVAGFGRRLGFTPTDDELQCLAESLPAWEPFPDTIDALRTLGGRYRLAVVSNVDDDLFASTAARLGVAFDAVITAASVGAYKPSPRMFEAALARLGAPAGRILHVAQSLYHDIAPAKRLGLSTVRVDRRAGRSGSGATPVARAEPDDQVLDLAGLVRLLGLS